jgi:hypothetical protein
MNDDEAQQDSTPQWLSSPRASGGMEGRSASGNLSWPPSAIEDFCSVHLAQSQADLRRAALKFEASSGSGSGSGSSSSRGVGGVQVVDDNDTEGGEADDGSPAFLLRTPSSSSDDDDINQLWPERWGSDSDASNSSSEDEMVSTPLLRAVSDDALPSPNPSSVNISALSDEDPNGMNEVNRGLQQGGVAGDISNGPTGRRPPRSDSDEDLHRSWDLLDEDGDLLGGSSHDDVSSARFGGGSTISGMQFLGKAYATASPRSTTLATTKSVAADRSHGNHSRSDTTVASPLPVAALSVPRGLHIAVSGYSRLPKTFGELDYGWYGLWCYGLVLVGIDSTAVTIRWLLRILHLLLHLAFVSL